VLGSTDRSLPALIVGQRHPSRRESRGTGGVARQTGAKVEMRFSNEKKPKKTETGFTRSGKAGATTVGGSPR